MTNMQGNPHSNHGLDAGYQTIDAYGQAQATLALAYEQRTANLLAAASATLPNGSGMFPEVSDGMRIEILERLGL